MASATVKKTSAPKKPRAHPPYVEMVQEAIVALKERTGSSQYAIGKFIEENQKDLPPNFKKLLLVQLKKLVAAGKLTKVKYSFKLAAAEKPNPERKPASAPAKKVSATVKKSPAKAVATPVKGKKVAPKPRAAMKKPKKVAKTTAVASPGKKKAVAVKKTPVKVVKKVKSIKSPTKKKVAPKKANK